MASSGTLPPTQAAQGVLDTGYHHLSEAAQLTFFKNIFGGLLLSAGGLLALILATGSPGLTEANPGLAQLLQGMSFPIGLVLVYTVGAELFTGYPMFANPRAYRPAYANTEKVVSDDSAGEKRSCDSICPRRRLLLVWQFDRGCHV